MSKIRITYSFDKYYQIIISSNVPKSDRLLDMLQHRSLCYDNNEREITIKNKDEIAETNGLASIYMISDEATHPKFKNLFINEGNEDIAKKTNYKIPRQDKQKNTHRYNQPLKWQSPRITAASN